MKKTFLLSIAFVFSLCSFAQQGIFTFYSVNEGLAQSTVTHIYRDTFGYLWVGTGGGLSLFNGYEFRNFKSRINDSLAISNNRIRSFQLSADGKNVWAGTEDGMNCFSREDGHVVKKIAPPEFSGMFSLPLYFNDTAYWFLVSSKGVFRKTNHDTKAKLIFNTSFEFRINPLLREGDFLFQTEKKELTTFSVLTGKSRVYELPEGLRGKDIYSSLEIKPGIIILCTESGLWLMEKESGKIQRYPFEDKNWNDSGKKINAACVDTKGRMWIAVRGEGLFIYDPAAKKVRAAAWEQSGISIQKKLQNITCLTADPYGIVWAGTDGYGLVKIISDRIFFGEEYFSPLVTDTCHWFTRSFYKDKNNLLWIGTFNEGIKIIDYNKQTIKTVFPDFQNGNKENSITTILPASGNALFIGTTNGLFLLDTITWKSKPVRIKDEKLGSELGYAINCMVRCKDGNVFVGTNGYLFCVKETAGELFLETCSQKKMNISALVENSNGNLIVAAVYLGLFSLEKDGQLKEILIFPGSNSLPGSTYINSFAGNGSGDWFASSSIGLLEFSNDFKFKRIYTDNDGLADNMLYGIAALPDHSYFISTGKGVSVFNPQMNSFENYSEQDGMKSNECNTGALYFSSDSIIYVGGVNGFDFKKFPFNKEKVISPKIYFEKQFAVHSTGKDELPLFEMNYKDNTFSFQLWQTDFTFSDRTSYNYQLNGFDPKEVIGGDRRFIRYVEVNPGEYDFVSSISFPGYTSAGIVPLFSVKIIPPYWQSTWFRLLSILFILLFSASVIYFIFHLKYKKKMRKLEIQRQLERVRIRISGDIHDDLGAGLTRIALTSDLVSRQLEENNPLKSRIANVADSARDLSLSLKEVVWSVKPEYDQLDSMVNYFKGYCGELFEDTDFAFSFHTIGIFPSEAVSPEIRRNLFLILKEACNNAMKHSNATKIEAKFQYEKGKIRLEISDNGCGVPDFTNENKMNSSGMKNMERRAVDLGFQFSVSENESGGCSVVVFGIIS